MNDIDKEAGIAASTLEAASWGDPTGEGMMAAMDKFFDGPPAGTVTSPVETTPSTADAPVKTADTPVVASDAAKEIIDDIEPDFFPSTAEPPVEPIVEPKAGEFDEAAFDKQTEEEVKGMDVKAGEKFRALKAELKAAKQTTLTPDVQAKIQTLELKAAEADGLRQRITELSSQSAKLQIENEEVYQNEIVKPAADVFTNADLLSEAVGIDPLILRTLIKERDLKVQSEMLEEHFGDKSLIFQSKVSGLAEKFNDLVSKRENMLANAESRLEQIRVAKIEADKKFLIDQRTAVQTIQKDLWGKYKTKIPGLVDDNGKETPKFTELMNKSLAIDFGLARAQDQAFAAISGVALPHALRQIQELESRLAVYEKSDKKKVQTAPSAGGSVQPTPSDKEQPKTLMERMDQATFA